MHGYGHVIFQSDETQMKLSAQNSLSLLLPFNFFKEVEYMK